jgi:predicted esterase
MSALGDLVHELRPAHGEPEGALVLLHGRATDEHDLLPLLDELDPDLLPELREFVARVIA